VGVGDAKILRETADKLKARMDPGVLVLVGAVEGKIAMVCAVTPGAQDKLNAGKSWACSCRIWAARAAAGQTWPKAGLPCLRMQP